MPNLQRTPEGSIVDVDNDQDVFVHPDETRTDEQIEFDERHALEPWDDNEDEGINPEDFVKPTTNTLLINLEKELKARAVAQGLSETEAAQVDGATFTIKDSDGNPTDTLQVAVSHYKGMYSRPGVQGFYISPIDGEKDDYGRDRKFVRGSFWGAEQPETPEDSSFSMSYGGGPTEAIHQYAVDALQADVLANADLIELKVPE